MKKVKFTKIAHWDMEDDNNFFEDGELLVEVDSCIDIEEYGCDIIQEEMPWMVNGFTWEIVVDE